MRDNTSATPECGSGENAERYILLPLSVLHDARLPPAAKYIFSAIQTFAGGADGCFASNMYFAELFRTSPRTVQRSISLLKELGLVEERADPATGRRLLAPKNTETDANQVAENVDFLRSM